MINSWTSAQYLGHKNLKDALDMLKRSAENSVFYPPILAACTGADYRGEGTYGRAAIIQTTSTFCFRIEDVAYRKGVGLIPGLLGGQIVNSAPVTAAKYKAGVILIDANGAFSFAYGTETDGYIGGKSGAIKNLVSVLGNTDLSAKAVVAFFIAGDGTNAFTASASLLVGTNLDLFGCGGMAVASGLSTDGYQMLNIL